MTKYKKGSNGEYKVAQYLWDDGWVVARQASSGGVGHEAADIIAIKGSRVLALEVKTSSKDDYRFDLDDQLETLHKRIGFDDGVYGGCYYVLVRGQRFYYIDMDTDVITPNTDKDKMIKLIRP